MFKKLLGSLILSAVMLFSTAFIGCGGGGNEILILAATEEERIEFLTEKLEERFPDYDITIQYVGTGELYSKLNEEKQNITGDIIYDLEATNAEMLLANTPDLFYDLSSCDFSNYVENAKGYTARHKKYATDAKLAGAIIVNKSVLASEGVPIPATYEDLLNPIYNDLICMPNPNQSGTGYCFYSGMVAKLGKTEALAYFNALNENIVEYTSSGSAPIKKVNSGEIGIGVCMLWQAVKYANENANLQVVLPDNTLPYQLYNMAIVKGRETRPEVVEVFNYLFTDVNKLSQEQFCGEKLFTNQGASVVANYPSEFTEFNMPFLYDYEYKQELLDAWGRS